MLFRLIAALIWGVAIGITIGNLLSKKKETNKDYRIEILEDLLKVYEVHGEELKDTIKYYKDGMNEVLEKNIDLKRRLNNGPTSRV